MYIKTIFSRNFELYLEMNTKSRSEGFGNTLHKRTGLDIRVIGWYPIAEQAYG